MSRLAGSRRERATMSGRDLATLLGARGFDFFAGVPCSLMGDLVPALEADAAWPYVAAPREDLAVGAAAGAFLAGRRPAVLMQNSGLGTSLNALASLTLLYRLPLLLLVTWRGFAGHDAPEHLLMGRISEPLLDLLEVPHRVLSQASVEADLDWAAREMDARSGPVALLLPPGVLAAAPVDGAARATPLSADRGARVGGARPLPALTRRAALATVVERLTDEPVVHANGYICRESFSVADRPQNFYMIGSMGLAAAIALGIALARPTRTPVVLDGDGNLLMGLGVLAMVGALRPRNFVHCVFDNGVYGSTGHQRSLSDAVRLDALAAAAGYRTAVAVAEADALADAVGRALTTDGPHFVLVDVTSADAEVPRIPHAPATIRDRVRATLVAA